MTQAEKDILNGIVQILENLTVGLDAVEGALIRNGMLTNGQRQTLEPEYLMAARDDLSAIRQAIAAHVVKG